MSARCIPTSPRTNRAKCTRCGMTLVATHPYDTCDYDLDFHTIPVNPKAGENVKLSFRIMHPRTGEAIEDSK